MTAPDTPTLDRRRFLTVSGGAAAALLAASALPASARAALAGVDQPFQLGVASGDPTPTGVVLWTRLAPVPLEPGGGMPAKPVPVHYEVAADESFRKVLRRGVELARPEEAHSVHAEVDGLAPDRWYWYRFRVGSHVSPIGRTRTAPKPGARTASLTWALASCQSWVGGRYGSYARMAEEDLDLVVHVGDYIYERAETASVEDFRFLHAQYKTSPDLQAAHANFPFVTTWDDHEVDNNWAGAISQDEIPVSEFIAMRAAAFQAYWEHLPLRRRSRPVGPHMRLYRRLDFGDLVRFNVLDTRQYRDDQVEGAFIAPLDPAADDPGRTMTGDEQARWLGEGLARTGARWNVVAQQTIMAAYDYDTGPGISRNHDQWDGYVAARDTFLGFVAAAKPRNPVVITGDWHSSWVNDLKADFDDPGSATLATELVGTSISSNCGWADDVAQALPANPHVKFFDGDNRGYLRMSADRRELRSDIRVVADRADAATPVRTLASFVVEDGRPGAVPA